MALRISALFALAVLLAGCGSSDDSASGTTTSGTATTSTSSSAAPTTPAAKASAGGIPRLGFGYDGSKPLAYADKGRINRAGYPIAVHDVSFDSGGQRIEGYLLLPPGKGRRPAVVFVHGAGGSRDDLIGQAAWLAARNVVALTLTEPSTSHAPVPATSLEGQLRQVQDVQVRDVVAVRRAVDVLRTLPQVDPDRIGYVGWSAGAKTGALVAASEPDLRALVLLSAGAAPLSDFVAQAPANLRTQVRRILGSIDPLRYVALARPGTLLLENGRRDRVVPRAALQNVARAAPRGTTVRWYDAPHELSRPAYGDAFDWLARKLRVTGPNVAGAATETTRG
jgi:dienelactone hydrolase